jgi:hypothetical protein
MVYLISFFAHLFPSLYPPKETVAHIDNSYEARRIYITNTGKYGFMTDDYKKIIKAKYKNAIKFEDGQAKVLTFKDEWIIIDNFGRKIKKIK